MNAAKNKVGLIEWIFVVVMFIFSPLILLISSVVFCAKILISIRNKISDLTRQGFFDGFRYCVLCALLVFGLTIAISAIPIEMVASGFSLNSSVRAIIYQTTGLMALCFGVLLGLANYYFKRQT